MPAIKSLTPGSYDPTVTLNQVQVPGFAASRRPTLWVGLKLKGRAMKRYGIRQTLNWHRYTLDHLVPLSLGGRPQADDNLWPQKKAEARAKDRDEAKVLRTVRSGGRTLLSGQEFFQRNWTK